MHLKIIIPLLLTTLISCRAVQQESLAKEETLLETTCTPSQNSCDFYSCYEKKKNCGSEGYVLKFGKPYCDKFLSQCSINKSEAKKFKNPKAQKWLQGVRKCLQIELQNTLDNPSISCQEIETAGFLSHASCYTKGAKKESGISFCELPVNTWLEIASCIDTKLANIKGTRLILGIFGQCSKLLKHRFNLTNLELSKSQKEENTTLDNRKETLDKLIVKFTDILSDLETKK